LSAIDVKFIDDWQVAIFDFISNLR